MNRRIVVSLGLALAASGLIVAPASAAGTYAVSLSSSRSVLDVGQVTVLSGKVTGNGAAKKTVALYQSVAGSAWKKLTTTRTTKKGTFSYKAKPTSAGVIAYKVVAPKSKTVAAGASKAVSLKAWRWLDLYDQPYLTYGGLVTRGVYPGTTVGGKTPPAHTFAMGSGAVLAWNFSQLCDRTVAQVGLSNSDNGETRNVTFQGSSTFDQAVTGGHAAVGYADLTASSVSYFAVRRTDDLYAYLLAPRAHCLANTLPVAVD